MPIRIVLVAPSHPANIGAAARAMKTMGLTELWLVAPAAFPHPEATALAAGADDLLLAARVVTTLLEAVADCGLVYATSARSRAAFYWPSYTPREAAPRLLAAAASNAVAVVFGTERTGLSNVDLELCAGVVQIPADSNFESLNLAQAVQILAYELRCAREPPAAKRARGVALASTAELERLRAHLDQVLIEIDFTDRTGGAHLSRRLARVFGRAELDELEVNMLRGFLTAVQSRRRRAGASE